MSSPSPTPATTEEIALAIKVLAKLEESIPKSLAADYKGKIANFHKVADALAVGRSSKEQVDAFLGLLKKDLSALPAAIEKAAKAAPEVPEGKQEKAEDKDASLPLNARIRDDGNCEEAAKALGVKTQFDKLIGKLKQANPVEPKHLGCYWEKNLATEGMHPSLFFKFVREDHNTATLVLDSVGVHVGSDNKYYAVDKKGKVSKNQIKTQAKWSG